MNPISQQSASSSSWPTARTAGAWSVMLWHSMLALVWVMFQAPAPTARAASIDYLGDIKPLLERKCYGCHGALKQKAGLRLDTGRFIREGGDTGPAVIAGDWKSSLLLQRITAADPADRMPPDNEALTAEQVDRIKSWILQGAPSPDDERPQDDPLNHWSLQPLREPEPSEPASIDAFIQRRLNLEGLTLGPLADRRTLIRRLFFDLHGLLPAPERVAAFVASSDPNAYSNLVEELLASPRYGERWAQHWLDIVRYADTHGYEVNTPRPNAWPYRDYIIQAFNEDKPYDQLVFEQLAGDAVGQDPATGFLVAAPVLLPGQIGQDEASKRLARQDALDEMIVGTTATFLGLTVGCARCHDHKFDPITQEDYYGMQAFFAGVTYGDREIRDAERHERLAKAEELAPQIADLETRLKGFEPKAFEGRTLVIDDEDPERVYLLQTKNGHGENPAGDRRGYKDDLGDEGRLPNMSRGRYTWWTNKSGVEVFAYEPGVAGRFRLWLSWGVHGSGAHTRDARYVLDRDGRLDTEEDQREIARINQHRLAGVEEDASEQKPLWSGLYDAGVQDLTETTRLVVRSGNTGSAITADVIVLQEVEEETAQAADAPEASEGPALPRLRAPVNAQRNVEHFAPTEARFVRFTTLETVDSNRHEPCLDELEVFAAAEPGRNIALAKDGVRATSSGNYSTDGQHRLEHINDGRYGNGRSWISDEKGGGWVQLELNRPVVIDRIIWSRDRESQYNDRLPVRYRVEVAVERDQWVTVASSDDRGPHGSPSDWVAWLSLEQGREDSANLPLILGELRRLEARQAELKAPRLVFAGDFREPDTTRLLARGDPEQPGRRLGPAVPGVLGEVALSQDAPEQERRIALARWISSPDNPLTARVMVNRVWQYHFGRGLVDTPSDFGVNGARPSHPELLDWLALEFMRHDWSIKWLHRLILSSETYRQSGQIDPKAQAIDGDNRLLWRYPSRRLEAEAIRDSLLTASGELNFSMGGPGFDFFKTRGGLSGFPQVEKFGPEGLRRMIYGHKIRMESVPLFGAFDCPDAGQPTPRRSQSTTAIQALNLFNSPFVVERAEAFARRIRTEAGDRIGSQVTQAFELALGRRPSATEVEYCSIAVREHGLPTLCRVLFNSNEFLFIP